MNIFSSIQRYIKTDTLGLMIITHGMLDVTNIETKTCPINLNRSILSPPGHMTTTNINNLHEIKGNIIKTINFENFKDIVKEESKKYTSEVEHFHNVYTEDEVDDPRTYSQKDLIKINKPGNKQGQMPFTVGHYTDEISQFTKEPKYINKTFSTDNCDNVNNKGLGIYTLNNYRNYFYSIPANTNIISETFLYPILTKLGIEKEYVDCIDETGKPIRLVKEITYDELFSILEYLEIKNIYIFDISCENFYVDGEECEDARTCRLIKYNMKREGVRGGSQKIKIKIKIKNKIKTKSRKYKDKKVKGSKCSKI
jgi:hypothetical protein